MNLYNFIKHIFSNDLLVQVWENRLKVSHLDSKRIFDEEPLMAIKTNKKGQRIVADIGDSVRSSLNQHNYQVVNPFSHPRLLLHDFEVAEKIFQHVFRELHKDIFFAPSPRVIFQPMEKLEGGITDIEDRAYRELCFGAGARAVCIYIGSELCVENIEVEKFNFKQLDAKALKGSKIK